VATLTAMLCTFKATSLSAPSRAGGLNVTAVLRSRI